MIIYIIALSFLLFSFGFNIALYNTLALSVIDYYKELTVADKEWLQLVLNGAFCFGSFVCCFFGSNVYQKLGLYNSTLVFLALDVFYNIVG